MFEAIHSYTFNQIITPTIDPTIVSIGVKIAVKDIITNLFYRLKTYLKMFNHSTLFNLLITYFFKAL